MENRFNRKNVFHLCLFLLVLLIYSGLASTAKAVGNLVTPQHPQENQSTERALFSMF